MSLAFSFIISKVLKIVLVGFDLYDYRYFWQDIPFKEGKHDIAKPTLDSMKIWKDGINADKHAADFAQAELSVSSNSSVQVKMAPGGGWVAILEKK